MSAVKSVAVPVLAQDRHLSLSDIVERTIVANMIDHLANAGWSLKHVYDGEEFIPVATTQEAMEVAFGVEMSDVSFTDAQGNVHAVKLIASNGADIICDWSFADGDADFFNAVMDGFDPYSFE